MFIFALTVNRARSTVAMTFVEEISFQAPACPSRDREQRSFQSFAVICHESRSKLVKVTSRATRFAFKTSLFTDLLSLTEIFERAYSNRLLARVPARV